MSDQDQFDDEFEGGEDEFDVDADFQSGQSIKELWRKNPLFKFGVIIVGLVVIIVSVNMFGKEEVQIENSSISTGQGATVRGAVGEEVTDIYREALETRNQQDYEEAVETDGAFIPVPVDPISTSIAPVAKESVEKEDPMAQWKELQEKRMRRQEEENKRRRLMEIQNQRAMAAMPRQEDPNREARQQALTKLSSAMMEQMAVVAQRHEYKEPKRVLITKEDMYFEKKRQEQERAYANAMGMSGSMSGMSSASGFGMTGNANSMMPMEQEDPLIAPGDILYGQMLIEANSDVPSVVMARVLTGHFEGSKILGSFSREEEHLVINFNQIVKDGKSYPINAVAVDPGTALPGLATEVNQRYFKRIVLPAAAKFIEGMTEAIADSGTTSIVGTYGETVATETEDLDLREEAMKGVSEASEIVTDLLLEEGEGTEILVRVEAGTPIGILFTDPVYENPQGAMGGSGLNAGFPGFGAGMPTSMNAALQGNQGGGINMFPNGVPLSGNAAPAGFDPASLNLQPN
ncbi:MAG: hypothetical protein CL561_13140 [Alphaproteobacteria bacterium]|nr:hypothetical protein [Alphaproteobacteria bacterium]|tara:strand:- start:57517 stop:59070 length:1554 start_codon:yes stop_codon:yes gene_type:complete